MGSTSAPVHGTYTVHRCTRWCANALGYAKSADEEHAHRSCTPSPAAGRDGEEGCAALRGRERLEPSCTARATRSPPCRRCRGGMQAVVAATGYRTLENVIRLIDSAILTQALDNSARPQGTRARAVIPRQQRQHASQRAQSLLRWRSSPDHLAVYDYASTELDRSSRGFGERGHASMRRRATALVCVRSLTTRSIVPSSHARSANPHR
jgi:hypothetical protein